MKLKGRFRFEVGGKEGRVGATTPEVFFCPNGSWGKEGGLLLDWVPKVVAQAYSSVAVHTLLISVSV